MRGPSTLCALLILSVPAIAEGTSCKPATATRLTTIKPLAGKDVRIVSGFGKRPYMLPHLGRMHNGVDWAAPRGTPVISAAAGLVITAEFQTTYGNTVIIDHGIDHGVGLQTVYAHLSSLAVHKGDCVDAGVNIGGAGSTGLASSMGVHFEVRRNGVAVDPMQETTAATEAKKP